MRAKIVGTNAIIIKDDVLIVAQEVCAAGMVITINPMDVTVHLGDMEGMNVLQIQAVFF